MGCNASTDNKERKYSDKVGEADVAFDLDEDPFSRTHDNGVDEGPNLEEDGWIMNPENTLVTVKWLEITDLPAEAKDSYLILSNNNHETFKYVSVIPKHLKPVKAAMFLFDLPFVMRPASRDRLTIRMQMTEDLKDEYTCRVTFMLMDLVSRSSPHKTLQVTGSIGPSSKFTIFFEFKSMAESPFVTFFPAPIWPSFNKTTHSERLKKIKKK